MYHRLVAVPTYLLLPIIYYHPTISLNEIYVDFSGNILPFVQQLFLLFYLFIFFFSLFKSVFDCLFLALNLNSTRCISLSGRIQPGIIRRDLERKDQRQPTKVVTLLSR
jgi:hypothetical protein